MARKKKEPEHFAPPPVITGHDDRPEEENADRDLMEREAEVPDGISGYWN